MSTARERQLRDYDAEQTALRNQTDFWLAYYDRNPHDRDDPHTVAHTFSYHLTNGDLGTLSPEEALDRLGELVAERREQERKGRDYGAMYGGPTPGHIAAAGGAADDEEIPDTLGGVMKRATERRRAAAGAAPQTDTDEEAPDSITGVLARNRERRRRAERGR